MKRSYFGAKLLSPCYGCEERKLGCHNRCDKYKEYRTKYDELNLKEKREKMCSHGASKMSHRIDYNKF